MNRKHKTSRPYQMRRRAQRDVPLRQRGAHPQRISALEIDEIAMHQMGSGRRRAIAEVGLFEQRDPQTAPAASRAMLVPLRPPPMIARSDIRHAEMISDGHHRESSVAVFGQSGTRQPALRGSFETFVPETLLGRPIHSA